MPTPHHPPVGRFPKWFLFAAPWLLVAAGRYGAVEAMKWLPNRGAHPYGRNAASTGGDEVRDTAAANGAALFAQNCAHCHGVHGDGRGVAPLANFVARNFTAERFKFTDALNPPKNGGGTPSDENLVALLKRGIPGSPMPSFAHLGDANLEAIVGHVRHQFLRPETRFAARKANEKAKAEKSDEGFDEKVDWSPANLSKWWAEAQADVRPGPPAPVPAEFPEPTPEVLARGEYLFKADAGLGCSKCHGPNGAGDGPQVKDPAFKNDNGTRAFPRDLTAGVYRGGGEPADLYRRVLLGIPGSPMPAHMGSPSSPTPPADLEAVVLYVRSLGQPKPAE